MKTGTIAFLATGFALPAATEKLHSLDEVEDPSRFAFASEPAHEDGSPANGSPAFPEMVSGLRTCDGHLVGDGMKTLTGDIVVSLQIYQTHGGGILMSKGTALADVGIRVTRAITGGTEVHAGA